MISSSSRCVHPCVTRRKVNKHLRDFNVSVKIRNNPNISEIFYDRQKYIIEKKFIIYLVCIHIIHDIKDIREEQRSIICQSGVCR